MHCAQVKYGSVPIDALATTLKKLGKLEALAALPDKVEVMRHWAIAMDCGLTMKASEEKRALFEEHARWYCLKKAHVAPLSLTWCACVESICKQTCEFVLVCASDWSDQHVRYLSLSPSQLSAAHAL
jgi:hypothetical protein